MNIKLIIGKCKFFKSLLPEIYLVNFLSVFPFHVELCSTIRIAPNASSPVHSNHNIEKQEAKNYKKKEERKQPKLAENSRSANIASFSVYSFMLPSIELFCPLVYSLFVACCFDSQKYYLNYFPFKTSNAWNKKTLFF